MKKCTHLFLMILIIFVTMISSVVMASENEYILVKEMVFKNERTKTLTNGFVEVMIGDKNITQYQVDHEVKITPAPDEIRVDDYGNKYAYYSTVGFTPGEELRVKIERTFETNAFDVTIPTRTDSVINTETELYLMEQERIESDDPMIREKATSLTKGITSDYRKALAIFEYVNTSISYDTNKSYANKGALSALKHQRGVCEEFANLYVALCRASNIPARVIEGYRMEREDKKEDDGTVSEEVFLINHVWTEIYLEDFGWVPVEPTVVYTVNGKREAYLNSFCKIENDDEYIAVGIYNYEKASRTMQIVNEISYKEYLKDTIAIEKEQHTFDDVTANYDWSKAAISKLYILDIVKGYSNTSYGPERNISRIEFISMLSRTLRYLNVPTTTGGMVYYHLDYDKTHWSKSDYDYLMRCYQAKTGGDKMSAGYTTLATIFGDTIQMNKAITRGEVVALMDVFMAEPAGENIFIDITGNRFASSILKSYANGLITGYPDGTFRPNALITRAEMAVILGRHVGISTYSL